MPSTRLRTRSLDVFEMYVHSSRTRQWVVDGWKKLKRDADPSIDWNPDALDVVSKAAIQCIYPFSEKRLSTEGLLVKINTAINLNANADIQNPEAESAVDSGPSCALCHNYLADMQCSEGHGLCSSCNVGEAS
ncbi:hypothetical protein MHU86_22805 [Fragilaria crotonensis]|nr:hypothetical protein MHU86_22805 [Fragilaria crotonensis]